MARSDWFQLAFKVLGVFFLVSGLASLGSVLQAMNMAGSAGIKVPILGPLFSSAVHLAAGALLVFKTSSCLQTCGEARPTN